MYVRTCVQLFILSIQCNTIPIVVKSTLRKDRTTGRKAPATELELGSCTPMSFSHELSVTVEILVPNRLKVLIMGVGSVAGPFPPLSCVSEL